MYLCRVFEAVQKALYAAIGAGSFTKDKIDDTLSGLVKQGKLTADEARDLGHEFSKAVENDIERGRSEVRHLVDDAFRRADLASQHALDQLEKRVSALEGKIEGLSATVNRRCDATGDSEPSSASS